MTPTKLFVVAAVGLSAAACSLFEHHHGGRARFRSLTAAAPSRPAWTTASTPAPIAYNRCVVREARGPRRRPRGARLRQGPLNADARDACYSYGLRVGTAPYDRCVGREIEARRYRDQAVVTTVPAYPATVSTRRPDDRLHAQSIPGPGHLYAPCRDRRRRPAFRPFSDEYGFRYDGQGNRIDAQGNIISPQSTRP